ncbi:MAG: glycosyltransferase family 4 protein [Simkaniaceae bacterium]
MEKNNPEITLVKYRLSCAGGLEKQAFRIAKAFSRRNIRVKVLTAQGSLNPIHYPLIEVKKLSLPKKICSFQKIKAFDKACQLNLKTSPSSIVFGLDRTSHLTHIRAGLGVHAAYLKRRKKQDNFLKRQFFSLNPLHRTLLSLEKKAFENPSLKGVFTNSFMVKNEILEHYKISDKKIHVIHNGVEWHELKKPFSEWLNLKNVVASNLNLDPFLFHFLFVGSGYKRKGVDLLLKAFACLKNEEVHLSIVGQEKEIKSYMELSHRLKLGHKVSFFGAQKDVTPFYQLADALVIPSLYDPNANVTIEALAMGLKVISSKFNGGSELINRENGLVIENLFDKDSLVKTLKMALDFPKTWMNSQRIRESVKQFDFQIQLDKMVNLTLNP